MQSLLNFAFGGRSRDTSTPVRVRQPFPPAYSPLDLEIYERAERAEVKVAVDGLPGTEASAQADCRSRDRPTGLRPAPSGPR